jgi:hypothetical protein
MGLSQEHYWEEQSTYEQGVVLMTVLLIQRLNAKHYIDALALGESGM